MILKIAHVLTIAHKS